MINRTTLILKKLISISDGDISWPSSYIVYISQRIRFASVCSNVDDLINRSNVVTSILLKQGYQDHKLHKAFSEFY